MKRIIFSIILLLFLAGCVSTRSELNYQGIYTLNDMYLVKDDTIKEDFKEIDVLPLDFKDPKTNLESGNFASQLIVFLGSDINNDIKRDQPDLAEFNSLQNYDDISLNLCEIRLFTPRDDYPYTGYITKCSDTESTVFITVFTKNKELAHTVLRDIHSAITS